MARDTITPHPASSGVRRRALMGFAAVLLVTAMPTPAVARPVDSIAVSAQACTIDGNSSRNTIVGTARNDVICGHDGGDRLQGKAGSDRLDGGQGNDNLFGGAGADDLDGGAGNDGLGGGLGPDELSGGPGRDIAFYGQRVRSVRVSIGDRAKDGAAGEGDLVHADVEDIQGGRGNDVLIGNGRSNRLFGGGGRDNLRGRGGNDLMMGGGGTDRVDARDGAGSVDRIGCGGGDDTALVDPGDVVEADCEHVVGGPQNRAPTGIALSNASVAENQPVATVGMLSAADPDPGDAHAFALVPGAGSDDNGSFQIVGTALRTAAVFNYEAKSTYSVRIRATDFGTPAGQIVRAFTITVDDVNEAPFGLDLSNNTLQENEPVGTNVADITVSDPDAGQQHSFTLVAGPGDADNAKFSITGSTLETAAILDFEAQPSYSIRIRATDNGTPALGVEQSFTVTVTNTLERPTPDPKNGTTDEDTPVTIQLSATDPEGDDVTSFATDNATNGTLGPVGPITCGGTPKVCTANVLFTPTSDFNGAASFTYTASDAGGASGPATVSIMVNPVNDTPTALDGSRTTNEDAPLTLDLASLVNDVETTDANLTYEIVTAPAHGTATTDTYTPAANFNGTDSLEYKVTDRGDPDNCGAPGPGCDAAEESATRTVSITVNPVNDTPVALDASRTTDEDTPLAVDLAALVSDLETADGDLTFTVTTPPGHGAVTGSGASRTYTPAANFNGSDSFTYTVTDRGDPDNCGAPGPGCDAPESDTGTVSITVNAVNDAPINTLPAGPVLALPNANTPINGISIADVDAGADDLEVTLSATSGTLTVALVPGGVTDITGSGTGTVVLVGSLLELNTTFGAPNGVVFNGAASTALEVKTDDLGHNGSGGALTDTDTVAINVNTPPVAADLTPSTNEDAPVTVTLSASDADGDDLSFAIGTGPSNGSLGPIGAVTCGPTVCTANVLYTPGLNFHGTDTFTYTASDGVNTSAAATVTITVNAVNDAPQLQNIEAGALAYTENDPATLITADTTVTDVDSLNFDTGTLTVDYSVGGTADDRLEILNQGQIATSGSNVTHGGTTIGTFTGGTGATPLVITLNANATPAFTQDLVRAIAYRNVSDNPSTAARTVRFVLTDGDGGTSAPATRQINLMAVNDVPVLADIEAAALGYTENDPATAITSSLTVADPDSNIMGATVSISANLAAAEDVLGFTDQGGITGTYNAGTGVLTLTGSASPAAYQTALRSVTYRNSSENPSTLTRTISFQIQDGPGAVNLSNVQSRNVTVTAVNDAPVADDETFSGAVGNTTFIVNDPSDGAPSVSHPQKTITGDILDGDTDVDGPGPLTVTPGPITSADGASVTMEADGDFTYLPTANSCSDTTDSFNYTVEDSGSPEMTDSGTVTIQLTGCVWYVRNNAAAGGDGTSDTPFDTLAEAETASLANHTVFVFDGNNTSAGYDEANGYTMNTGERLIGEHEGLVIGSDTLFAASPGAKPTLTASGADVISLDSGNEIRGFVIDPQGTGGGIAGAAGDTGGTIDDVDITDSGTAGSQAGLELNGTAGTFNGTNFTVNNSATGVLLNGGAVDFGSTTITSSGAKGLDATGTNMGTSTFNAITVNNSGNGGVRMSGTSGTTDFGDGTGVDLALTTSSSTAPAFQLTNAGTITVGTAGVDNVSAGGGPAIEVTGAANLAFDDVDSTSSTGDGIDLVNFGSGNFSAATGDIASAQGIAFDLEGGNGTVTYPGTIGNGAGQSAEITSRSGGTVTLSGAINDTNDAGGGISLSGNSGGSTTFSGTSKVLNTTTSDAVSFTGSDGHTLSHTNGGLDVDTSSGQGVVATNSGTLVVSGSGNSVSTGTGRGVNVQNTDFGATGFTFESVSSNGAPNGILLNNTGTSAGMTITGTGANNSGGSIQNATQHGVSLTTTQNFSADELSITGANFAGVDGTDVTNFTFTDGEILNSGDSLTDNLHGAIAFNDQAGNENNIDGTLVITGNLLKDHYGGGLDVFNRNGTISDATVSNNTIDSVADEALSREDAISFNLFGSATTVASMTKAQIEDNVITDHPSGNGIVILGAQTNISPAPTPTIGVPGSSTNRILIDGNQLTGDPVNRFGGAAILAGVEGRGVANFDITNNGTAANPITNAGTHGIATGNSGSSEVEYLIENNYVSANNFEAGGLGIRSASDRHIMVGGSTLDTPTLKAIINNNVVRNTTGGGIRVLASNSNGTSEVKVTNNDVANGAAGTFPIRVENGSSADATFDPTMCATISGNTTAANAPSPGGNTFPGIGLFKRSTVAANYQFGITGGLAPSPSTNANTESFVFGLNPNLSVGGGFYAGKHVSVDAGDNFVSCTHPAGF